MDIYKELLALLYKAKEVDEYFNPHALHGIIEVIEDAGHADLIPDEIYEWVRNMWSW